MKLYHSSVHIALTFISYLAGAFDLFYVDHVDLLEKAAEEGDFIIVKVYKNSGVKRIKDKRYPFQSSTAQTKCRITKSVLAESVMITGLSYIKQKSLKKINNTKVKKKMKKSKGNHSQT